MTCTRDTSEPVTYEAGILGDHPWQSCLESHEDETGVASPATCRRMGDWSPGQLMSSAELPPRTAALRNEFRAVEMVSSDSIH